MTAILWHLNVTGNNKTFFGVQVKCWIFLADFNQIWIFLTDLHDSLQYQASYKSIQWEPCWYTDRWMDMTKLTATFQDYTNVPKMQESAILKMEAASSSEMSTSTHQIAVSYASRMWSQGTVLLLTLISIKATDQRGDTVLL